MKNFLQNLLIFLSMCLCALIAVQWHMQTKAQQEIQKLNNDIHDDKVNIQGLDHSVKQANEEIKRLDGIKLQLTETVKSNRTDIVRLTKDLDQRDQDLEKQIKTVETYKGALEQANARITQQNEAVTKQNEEIKKLADERNEIVAKYNQTVKEFNDLAQKWNDAQAAAATNAPPKK